MKIIALAREAFSRNIGDQAIHACLVYLLRQQDVSLEMLSLVNIVLYRLRKVLQQDRIWNLFLKELTDL